jgi:hypothetical protein
MVSAGEQVTCYFLGCGEVAMLPSLKSYATEVEWHVQNVSVIFLYAKKLSRILLPFKCKQRLKIL